MCLRLQTYRSNVGSIMNHLYQVKSILLIIGSKLAGSASNFPFSEFIPLHFFLLLLLLFTVIPLNQLSPFKNSCC